MSDLTTHFIPPRRQGLLLQVAVVIVLSGLGGLSLWQAVVAELGGRFLVFLLATLVFLAPVPLLGYRIYALLGASYNLERDGLQLRWGLRVEDIPMPDIEWVRPAADLATPLRLPWLRWPGSLRGTRHVEGLGPVEYIASGTETLLLVATPFKIYAISPAQPEEFQKSFYRAAELGSLTPFQSQSVYPTVLLGRVWKDMPARILLLVGLGLGILLLGWVTALIPSRATLPLGYLSDGVTPGDPGPAVRLLLLPVLDGLAYLVDLLAGLYFYRHEEWQPIAYLLWSSAAVLGILLLLGVYSLTQF